MKNLNKFYEKYHRINIRHRKNISQIFNPEHDALGHNSPASGASYST